MISFTRDIRFEMIVATSASVARDRSRSSPLGQALMAAYCWPSMYDGNRASWYRRTGSNRLFGEHGGASYLGGQMNRTERSDRARIAD